MPDSSTREVAGNRPADADAAMGPGRGRASALLEEGMDGDLDAWEQGLALATGAELIGINARNLKTLDVDTSVYGRLAPLVPEDRVLVAESGVFGPADVQRFVDEGARAVLVGEALVKDGAPREAVAALQQEVQVNIYDETGAFDEAALGADIDRELDQLLGLGHRLRLENARRAKLHLHEVVESDALGSAARLAQDGASVAARPACDAEPDDVAGRRNAPPPRRRRRAGAGPPRSARRPAGTPLSPPRRRATRSLPPTARSAPMPAALTPLRRAAPSRPTSTTRSPQVEMALR